MDASELSSPGAPLAFLLTFLSLHGGMAFTFPCDETGLVPLDTLSDRARCNYLLARTLIGRDYRTPVVAPADGALQ
jgi:hypothetical protein